VEQTDAPSPRWALERLRARGCARVLVEGGGDLIAQLLADGLLHELHVTLCPLVVGGAGAPTLSDGPGFLADALPRLRLLSCEPAGDEVFLRYAVAG
jgi:5-amino-6-(5-phosphoribosylamino)uracil reductase